MEPAVRSAGAQSGMLLTIDPRKRFRWTFCASSKKPSAAVNIEFHSTLVSHFQQKGLASFLVCNIRSSHDLVNLERLFAQSAQDIVSIIQHAFSLRHRSRRLTDNTKAHLPSLHALSCQTLCGIQDVRRQTTRFFSSRDLHGFIRPTS